MAWTGSTATNRLLYQRDLRDAVLEAVGHRISQALADYEQSAVPAPASTRRATTDVLVPVPVGTSTQRQRTTVNLTGGNLSAMRDFRAKQLGDAGEAWVLDLEREQLHRLGRTRSLQKGSVGSPGTMATEPATTSGSFRPDGSDRLIEVKTTTSLRSPDVASTSPAGRSSTAASGTTPLHARAMASTNADFRSRAPGKRRAGRSDEERAQRLGWRAVTVWECESAFGRPPGKDRGTIGAVRSPTMRP